jgi:hypothetical protein
MIRFFVMRPRAIVLPAFLLSVLAGCASAPGRTGPAPGSEDLVGKDSLKTNPLPPLVAKAGDDTPDPTPKGKPATPPPAAATDDPGAKYAGFVSTINTNMPGWKTGAAAALMLFNSERNEQKPFLFDNSEQAAVPKGDHYSLYMDSDAGWFVVLIPEFKPGHYECNKDPIISLATSFDKDFTGDDPKTMWSMNKGGSCKVDISPGKVAGDYIARISGIVVSNDEDSLLRIQSAYVYFRNMPSGPPPKTAAPAPTSNKVGPSVKTTPVTGGPKVRLPR